MLPSLSLAASIGLLVGASGTLRAQESIVNRLTMDTWDVQVQLVAPADSTWQSAELLSIGYCPALRLLADSVDATGAFRAKTFDAVRRARIRHTESDPWAELTAADLAELRHCHRGP